MTRRHCLGCQDDHRCRHTGYVPAGSILVPCRCLGCDPEPIQARLFSHALIENDLGACADCGQPDQAAGRRGRPARHRLVRGLRVPRYLAATGGRDYANEERIRWGRPPIPRPELR